MFDNAAEGFAAYRRLHTLPSNKRAIMLPEFEQSSPFQRGIATAVHERWASPEGGMTTQFTAGAAAPHDAWNEADKLNAGQS